MDASPGLRERKKRQTRRRLVETALRLFDEQGYAATTVVQIAAAADVAPRTFFSYFDTKEDVVFGLAAERTELALEVIAERRDEDSAVETLRAAFEAIATHGRETSVDTGLAAIRARLVRTVPAVRARGLLRQFASCERLSEALADAHPDELDLTTAAAMVGAVAGAQVTAAMVHAQRGAPPEAIAAAAERAVEGALKGWESR